MTRRYQRDELLIVFAKASDPGHVKTRLVPPLTEAEAADLNSAFTLDTVARHSSTSRDLMVCLSEIEYDADGALHGLAGELEHAVIGEQKGDGLGRRMENAFEEAFEEGYHRVVILGSDHPSLPRYLVADAFTKLKDDPGDGPAVVLGPAFDGGYYLIGMNHLVRDAFKGMVYSHDRVLDDTVGRIERSEAHVELLDEWYDVDDEAGLIRLTSDLESGRAESLPQTERVLRRIGYGAIAEAEAREERS